MFSRIGPGAFVVAVIALVVALLDSNAALAQKETNTLVWGVVGSPRHLNPAVQSGVATMEPGAQIFASPLRVDDDWKMKPYLAESWSYSDDAKTLTLKVRSGAKFHDGQPITSADFAFSIMAVKKYHPFQSMMAAVDGVDTPDPSTAVIHLSQPNPALLLALTPPFCPILPKHIFDDGQNLATHPHNSDPVGSGPFKLVEFKPGEHVILEKFQDFFIKDRPRLDRVVMRIFKDSNALTLAVEAKEVNFVPFLAEVAQIDRLANTQGITVTDKGGEGIGPLIWIAFNLSHKPFDDVRVRQAISYMIDRDFITKRLQRGRTVIATGPITPGSPYYNPDVERYKLNQAKAEELLDAAGLKKDEQGVRFKTTITYAPGGRDYSQNIAEYAKAQLKKVGIDLELTPAADFPSWAKKVGDQDFDVTMDAVFNWGDPMIGVNRTYLTSNIRKGVIWSNTQSYSNPKVDELLTKAAAEPGLDKRKALYKEFQSIVVNDAPVMFINVLPTTTAYDSRLKDIPTGIWSATSPIDEMHWE
jgi:peptide/nickel transport system substrate-binding protein